MVCLMPAWAFSRFVMSTPLLLPLDPQSAHPSLRSCSSRRLCTPNCLQKPILLRKSVEGVVALGARPHEAAQRIDLVLACVAAVLIDLADADLYARVVFGLDDAVGGAAFAGDVARFEVR